MTLEKVNEGVIWVDGVPLTHEEKGSKLVPASEKYVRRIRRRIGMVFQQFNLFPNMNVIENITEAPIHVLGLDKAAAVTRARELLETVGLSDKGNRAPDATVRWPAAAGGDRESARHGPRHSAARRGHVGAGSRVGGGRPRRAEERRAHHRHHDADRHARDAVRAGRVEPG